MRLKTLLKRKTNNGSSGYRGGRYFIRVDSPRYQPWSRAGQDFSADVIVNATAGSVAGSQENEMGVICRYVEIVFDDFEVIRP